MAKDLWLEKIYSKERFGGVASKTVGFNMPAGNLSNQTT